MDAVKARISLIVTEVLETVQLTKAKKYPFKARGQDGKELVYFTYSDKIATHIVKDAKLDTEVETSSHENNGNTYIDRKVTQLYEGGQPVTGQRGNWNKPDNTVSIESQSALKFAGELMVNKIIDMEHPLAKAALRWSESRLGCLEEKTESKSDPEWEKLSKKTFKDAEDFKQAVYGRYMLTPNQLVGEHPEVVKLAKAGKFTEAWEVLETTIKALSK